MRKYVLMKTGSPLLETGVKYLFILKRVIESSVTALWNRRIIRAHTQFDVYEYVDD